MTEGQWSYCYEDIGCYKRKVKLKKTLKIYNTGAIKRMLPIKKISHTANLAKILETHLPD